MKKMILAAAALMMAAGASAQMPSFEWGVKAGLNVSGISNIDDSKMKASIYVGAFAEFHVNDWLGIQPEVIYSRQGFAVDDNSVDYARARLNYLNIPIMGKFYVLDNLSFETGPQFGFLLNAREKIKANGTSVKADIDGREELRRIVGRGRVVPHFRSAGRDVPLQHRPDESLGYPGQYA